MSFAFSVVPTHRYHGGTGRSTAHQARRHGRQQEGAGARQHGSQASDKGSSPRPVSPKAASGPGSIPKQLQRGKHESICGHHMDREENQK